MPTLREIHRNLRSDSALLLWAIFFIEAPRKRRNLWRYQAYLAAGAVWAAWCFRHTLPLEEGVFLGYLGMRFLAWIAQYTPVAKAELLE